MKPNVVPPAPIPDLATEVSIPMRDGVRLSADLYLPSHRGRVPAVLLRWPYDKSSREHLTPFVGPWFADRGFAFVAQDTRGKFRSGGRAEAFVHEMNDGYDTLEWLRQQPWCSGRVGTWGESYAGFTQWAAAASGHPALAAMVVRNTSANVLDGWLFRQGVFELVPWVLWAGSCWVDGGTYLLEPSSLDWATRPLRDVLCGPLEGERSASLDTWVSDPLAVSSERLFRQGLPSLYNHVPTLHIGGWWDQFRHGQMQDWSIASVSSPAPQHLVMHATDHLHNEWTDPPIGPVQMAEKFIETMTGRLGEHVGDSLAFYDQHLKGEAGGTAPRVRWQLTGADQQVSPCWPPPESVTRVLFLTQATGHDRRSSQGSLSVRPSPLSTVRTWIHDPNDLVPTPPSEPMLALADPPDDRTVEARPDVLVFTSEPLRTPIDLAGPVVAVLEVGSSAPSMHLVVRLLDVFPDGRTRRVCDGAALIRGASQDSLATVSLGHVGYRVRTDHCLRVHVASSDFPRLLPYPGTEDDPWTAERVAVNEQRLRIGGHGGSRLEVSVLAASTALHT